MKLINSLQSLNKKIYRGIDHSFFSEGYEKQKKKIDSFEEPKDLIERSYYQYLSQTYNLPFILRFLQNATAIPFILYYIIRVFTYEDEHNHQDFNSAIFLREGVSKDILPNSLLNEYAKIEEMPLNGSIYFDSHDKKMLLRYFKNYIKSPFFILKCLIKIGVYSNVIHNYKPNAIITHNEYSFTSSILTKYCNEMKVEHINVMHGEKLFNIRDAFVKFDRFYVWDEHYVNLFIKMRADKLQFRVEIPQKFQSNKYNTQEYDYELTYYLAGEDEESLNILANNLKKLIIPTNKICIRYHPRHSNIEQLGRIFSEFNMQDPEVISIEESLMKTNFVASLYSTVLYEAYIAGKEIIVDDITNNYRYNKLKSLEYIIINKNHILLSTMIR